MVSVQRQTISDSHPDFPPIEEITVELWGPFDTHQRLFNGQAVDRLDEMPAYFEYLRRQWFAMATDADGRYVTARQLQDVYGIVRLLREGYSRDYVLSDLKQTNPGATENACSNSINLAIRLLLMLKIGAVQHQATPHRGLEWQSGTLASFLHGHFGSPQILDSHVRLPKTFNAWSIAVIGGLAIEFTDNIADHLRLIEDDGTLLVFHHASFLERQGSSLYPEGFVNETLRTLALLFPQSEFSSMPIHGNDRSAWLKRTCRKYELGLVDKRVALCGNLRAEDRQIERFTFWRDRLIILKQVYDDARPNTLHQWWHDRRNGERWFTFWVAVLVLVITTTLGLIQTIESALQVYKAYYPN
ncbi:hypothetical protein F5Y18DRAFT_431279 [Xylariaceae sp. FL1019]|nr:hypothetical protein F5Y18DRAFT_431279 [Xylariaceae sp. FL1019]